MAAESPLRKAARKLARKLVGITGVNELGDVDFHPDFDKKVADDWARREKVRRIAEIEPFLVKHHLRAWGASVRQALKDEDGGVIREDLVDDLVAYTLETALQTPILDLYRGYISDPHYQMLATASAAHNLRSLGKDAQAKRLVESSERAYGPDARKINNLYSSGYLQSIFACELQMHKAFSYENAKRLFRSWFEERLRFFEDAIFVNFLTSVDEVWSGLDLRFVPPRGSARRVVSVWAAGKDKVLLAQDALTGWTRRNAGFDYATYAKPYGSALGVQFAVFNQAIHTEMRPSRLDALLLLGGS